MGVNHFIAIGLSSESVPPLNLIGVAKKQLINSLSSELVENHVFNVIVAALVH